MLLTFLHIIPSLFSAPDDLSVSDDMEKGVINSIKIEGVKGEGDYKLSDNKWDWSNSTAAGPYTVSFAGDEGKVEGNRALTGVANDNKVLMMIPQPLGDGAKVTINFTPTGQGVKEASFSLGGTTWAPGSHITYVLSTTKMLNLNMDTVTYPDGWNSVNTTDVESPIKSSYTDGDAIGMYVVDKYNKVIEANLKFTYNGSQWAVESGKEFKGSPQYNYFVYYPYQEGGLPGAPAKNASNIDVTSAASFFADAIKKWGMSLKTDQGDDGKFNSCDLQIGKADDLGESGTTIIFRSMTHAMGLAHVKLGKRSLSSGVTYISKNDFGSSIEPYTWGGNIAYASSEVAGRKLFPLAKYDYACIVSPGISTEFNTASGVKNAWEKALTFTPSTNKVQMLEALVADTGSGSTEYYTIQLGDIYYNDGSISHDLDETITDKHYPVGIIVYLAKDNGVDGKLDYWVETNTKNADVGGHGLVMCLKTIGSTGPTNIGTGYRWYSDYTDAGRTKVTSKKLIVDSKNQLYGSGYTETTALIQKWGSAAAAAYQAKNYSTLLAPTNKCTGWFLPSAGQYYAALSQLDSGGMSSDWDFYTYINVTTEINGMLEKVGGSNYTYFFQKNFIWGWTSSEYSSPGAVVLGSGVDDSKGSGSVRFYVCGEAYQRPVRPFLAF